MRVAASDIYIYIVLGIQSVDNLLETIYLLNLVKHNIIR